MYESGSTALEDCLQLKIEMTVSTAILSNKRKKAADFSAASIDQQLIETRLFFSTAAG